MELLRLSALFALTALAEITGCYLPWLVLKQGKSALLLLPAAASLALFAWLLTLAARGGWRCAYALGCNGRGYCAGGDGGDCVAADGGLRWMT